MAAARQDPDAVVMDELALNVIVTVVGLTCFGLAHAVMLVFGLIYMERNHKRRMEALRRDHERKMAEIRSAPLSWRGE